MLWEGRGFKLKRMAVLEVGNGSKLLGCSSSCREMGLGDGELSISTLARSFCVRIGSHGSRG